MKPQGALASVKNNRRAIGEFHGTRLDAGQRRNTERARKNGDMGGRAAPIFNSRCHGPSIPNK
jgi:hypothetical protein